MPHYVAQVKNNETSNWEFWHGATFHKCSTEAEKYLETFLSFMKEASTRDEAEIKRENYRIVMIEEFKPPHRFF